MAIWVIRLGALLLIGAVAFELTPQTSPDAAWSPRLLLTVVEGETGEPIAARFSLTVDGRPYEPRWVGTHGVRFASVHVSKRQTFVATYARGTGAVEVPLPLDGRNVEVHVAKGFDYFPTTIALELNSDPVELTVRLRRSNRLHEDGWRAADAHLHYDRPAPEADRDWFDMLAGDGLSHGQFMVLKGGMVPGIWAEQFAYGAAGTAVKEGRTIIPGMEYRDQMQGHILLFGLSQVIQPIMTRGPHYPTFFSVLNRARSSGGLVGAAHGALYGGSTTGVSDAVLGALDFWGIGNAHLWTLDAWYRLMNAGYILPPVAGTDLPNNPDRELWQPFLGSMRMYARTHGHPGAEPWNAAVRRGEVFATSGPIISLTVNGQGPGGEVRLPAQGGEVDVVATLESPRRLSSLEVVRNGRVEAKADGQAASVPLNALRIEQRIRVERSSWIAARGQGAEIPVIGQNAVAHTAAVRVLVGDAPIGSREAATSLADQLRKQRGAYETTAEYDRPEHRLEMLALIDRAISKLEAN